MRIAIFFAIVIFGLLFLYTNRYEIISTHETDPAVAYRLDRWTGEVTQIQGRKERSTRKMPSSNRINIEKTE